MPKNECSYNCRLAAAVVGLLVWIFNGTFLGGFFLGLITFFLLGKVLVWGVCSECTRRTNENEHIENAVTCASFRDEDSTMLNRSEQIVVNGCKAFSAATSVMIEKSRNKFNRMRDGGGKSGQDKSVKNEIEVNNLSTQINPSADQVKKAGSPSSALSDLNKAQTESQVESNPQSPTIIKVAEADNLKEIKGIGPALEELLYKNDVTSFIQIAGWTDADIDHYAGLIGRMGGRIRSDDWVAQAKILAAGSSTEFSRRVDNGEVY